MTEQTMEIVEQVHALIQTTLDAALEMVTPGSIQASARRIGHEWAHLLRMLSQLEESK